MMNVLILGGNVFAGRHIADALLLGGHKVTYFNRGISAQPRADVETVLGDRKLGLDMLAGRSWDAVVDTCGYFPNDVRLSARWLRDRANRYVYISPSQ